MYQQTTRRSFIGICGSAVVGLAVRVEHAEASGALSCRRLSVNELKLETFQPFVGSTFSAVATGQRLVSLRLAHAEKLAFEKTHDMKGQPLLEGFALLFEGTVEDALPQGLYELSHPDLGQCAQLFMTPVVCPDPTVRHYEVIFNRFVAAR